MDTRTNTPSRSANLGLMVSLLWCAAVWLAVVYVLATTMG